MSPRFVVEINRTAYGLLEELAKEQRRKPQDQAGVELEQMLEARRDAEASYLAPDADPVSATAADPDGDMHKTALG